MAPFLNFFSASHECELRNRSGLLFYFISLGVYFLSYKMPTLTFRLVNFIDYLPLKLLFVWTLLRFRSCSCLAFAACFAAESSSGAYSSNFSKSFTAPSLSVAVFYLFFSSSYKSPLFLARTLFRFSSSLFFIRNAMISVSFFFPEKGIFSDFADS